MDARRVTITGATGLIGRPLVAALQERGAEVTVLSRDPDRARARLGEVAGKPVEAVRWDPLEGSPPAHALSNRDAVVHLAGENIAQRWSGRAKRAICESRVTGTRHLVASMRACEARPRALVCASGVSYYGSHGEEPLDEDAPPGNDFLAQLCVAWEAEADGAGALGTRVVQLRTGVVLAPTGGALAKMLPAFRLGVGGPVAGGAQYLSWIHLEDVVEMILTALCDERWSGPVNVTAPEPVRNREFAHTLGRTLRRPARVPVPELLLRAMYGEMAETVTVGVRAMPAKALVLGYPFRHPRLPGALRSVLARG